MNDDKANSQQVIPVIEEELVATKRIVKTGSVRVQKHVDKRMENVTMPLIRQTVEVKRVPVNREIESMPETRTIGATTIIPVVEEEIVVTKRMILKEEIHLTRHHSSEITTKQVQLGKERAEVLRVDAEGRVVDSDLDHAHAERRIIRRKT
jgi:uncharacterized protein (TIGR02271 family)